MLATWQDGEVRDIHQEMMQLTMRIVAKVLFSVEVKEDTGKSRRRAEHSDAPHFRGTDDSASHHAPCACTRNDSGKRAVRELDEIVNRIIRERRASGQDTGDLLSMLIAARDEDGSGMTDRQLRDEVLTFLLAGHETTAVSLSWTWYLLSQHPEVEAEAAPGIEPGAGRAHAATGRPASPSLHRQSCEGIHAPLSAGLEPGPHRGERMELAGYRLPVGANVVMSPWIMHRDPRFFEQPEQFDPDRWTTGRSPAPSPSSPTSPSEAGRACASGPRSP